MEKHQQEIGASKALLQLGSKSHESDGDINDYLNSSDAETQNAVEAAVMRLVGGTLNDHSRKKRKRSSGEDEYDFNQWSGFLNDQFQPHESKKKKKKKKDKKKEKKKKKHRKDDSDLELDHEQLVEAIQDVRTNIDSETNHTSTMLNPQQEARILAAANAMVEAEQRKSSDADKNLKVTITGRVINPIDPPQLPTHDFSNLSDLDDLRQECTLKLTTWYEENVTPDEKNKPKPFDSYEDEIIDYYFAGWCHLQNLTRQDLCNRIWSNDRRKDKFWKKIELMIPYRSQSSIYKHIRRRYHIFDFRAQWTKEEEEKMNQLAVTHPGKWKYIGELMGRMPEDCRDRWRNYAKCGENRVSNRWTKEDEMKLLSIVNEMMKQSTESSEEEQIKSINWTVVSEKMNGERSRIQCRYKFTNIKHNESKKRVASMENETKYWIIKRIKKYNYRTALAISWTRLSNEYNEKFGSHWKPIDFKTVYDQLVSKLKNLTFDEQISYLIDDLKRDITQDVGEFLANN